MDVVETSGDEEQIVRSSNGQLLGLNINCVCVKISVF